MDAIVYVTIEIIAQKAQPLLVDDHPCAQRQPRRFPRRQRARGFLQKAADDGVEVVQAQAHPRGIRLVLGRCVGARAHEVSEIVECGAGHHRIQVQHAHALAADVIDEDVVELGVVVRDPQGQFARVQSLHDSAGFVPAGQGEVDEVPGLMRPVVRIRVHRLHERLETFGRVMKIGDGDVHIFGGEIIQPPQKAPEGPGRLVEMLGAFHLLIGPRAFDEKIGPPVVAIGRDQVGASRFGWDQCQGLALRIAPFAFDFSPQKFRHLHDIGHERVGLAKDALVDALQDVAPRAAGALRLHHERIVDVPDLTLANIGYAAVERELRDDLGWDGKHESSRGSKGR